MDKSLDSPETVERHNFHVEEAAAETPEAQSQSIDTELWEAGKDAIWRQGVLTLFMQNQLKLAPILPLLAIMLAFTSLQWMTSQIVMIWLVLSLSSQAAQLYLCYIYLHKNQNFAKQHEWIAMLTASELTQGVTWTLPLFLFWEQAAGVQGAVLVAFTMAVIAVRLLVVNSFMPVLIAGTGIMTLGVALRCITQQEPVYFALAALVIVLEVFFLFIARQLSETERDMVKFKEQKDTLIDQLSQERDRAEAARAKAEAANEAKSVFLATMSHELRTPLNAIMGFSEIINREMFGPHTVSAYREYAGDIHHSGRYLLDLINDILDLSRIEAGRRDIQAEPFAVESCVNSALALLGAKAKQKSISVTLDLTPGLPKLLGDIRAVNQMMINLLANAVKFTPVGGSVVVSAGRSATGAMVICVKDTGPGIPAHEVEHALKSFARGSLATKQAIDGAGLGLPIVKGLMDLHGGTIKIESAPGKGTEVYLTFPATRVLTGPRGEVLSDPMVQSESQRKLIAITG
jgi:two-component system, cell cycle sensor histidine kinase PleC